MIDFIEQVDFDKYKYIIYSSCVPIGETCIRIDADKEIGNILQRVECNIWNYPTFKYVQTPDKIYLSPYGNLYWLYESVLINKPIYVTVYNYGNGKRTERLELATVEIGNNNIYKISKQVENRWK